MLLFAVLLVTLLALLVSFILYVLSTANTNIAIAINILMQCMYIYIYMLPPPRSTYCILLSPKFLPESFLHNQKGKPKKKKKTEKTEKNNRKTKRQNKRLWGNSGWDISLRVLVFLVFLFFLAFSVASEIFLKKHFPLPAFGIHYFCKKTAFPKRFQANYFKL